MSGDTEWIRCPLNIVQRIFENPTAGNSWEKEVTDYFKEKLEVNQDNVPSLNCCSLNSLPSNSLVRFRGFIQDMFDPEFYMSSYETIDPQTQKKIKSFGRFRDTIEYTEVEDVNYGEPRERMVYYCMSIPGENKWVKDIYESKCQQNHKIHTNTESPSGSSLKRRIENDDPSEINSSSEPSISDSPEQMKKSCNENSRTESNSERLAEDAMETGGKDYIETSEIRKCIVKAYDDTEHFHLNDCYEFVGIFVSDPNLAFLNDLEERLQSTFLDGPNETDNMERKARCPPASAVPRLHIIHATKITHNNPLLPMPVDGNHELNLISNEADSTRSHLLAVLEMALLGDSLAAEYLLCHLISSVYVRRDVVTLGKFCLNLSGVHSDQNLVTNLNELIKILTPQSTFFSMSLTNLNTGKLIPKKDYTRNRLETGLLQLGGLSHLIIDEIAMTAGQLDAKGIQNLGALSNLITWQKILCDFNYHTMEYMTNIAVLILSEGKSLLPSDCNIPLVTTVTENNSSHFDAIRTYLTPVLLDEIRCYLSALKVAEFTVNEDMQKEIQEDFVAIRRVDVKDMSAEDLHALLVLARLLGLSRGERTLTRSAWEDAKRLERLRKSRLSSSS